MSKIEVDAITQQSGSTLTVGGGASKTVVADATTVTLGRCGGTVALASGATQTGFGRTGTVDWQTTPKTGDFTAVNGEGYFVNTTSGAITMTMPSGSAGAIVSIQDYNKTFDSNSFTVTPASGEKINGGVANGDLIISTEGQGLTFVYVDATVGWKTVYENDFTSGGTVEIIATGGTITTSGNCKIHTFTGPGTFCVSSISGTPANNQVSYLVVAGGGAGGDDYGGGGGAGGFREDKSPVTPYTASPLEGAGTINITATAFPITVGAGGTTNTSPCGGSPGAVSTFSTITSAGGGGGGSSPSPAGVATGGSGGGGGSYSPVPYGFGPGSQNAGAAGNTPPTNPPQGNTGGFGLKAPNGTGGGGGGGATAAGVGSAGPSPVPGYSGSDGGNGGAGATTSITASPVAYAGGGGGSSEVPVGGKGDGGTGGGGIGRYSPGPGGVVATSGTANTGGGGGGGYSGSIGAGGSGIVVIRYKFQ
jgi:mucin-19